jgi:methyl-accepting chemotaxis protein
MHEANAKGDVRELLRDFEHAMQGATTQIRQDLERARTVTRDATARLDRSFRSLEATSAAQREALHSVSKAFAESNQGQGFAASSEALLRQFVDEVVRVSRDSLKMVDQLTDLSAKVDSITNCADAIDGLARETRFIAFNARIETHRAGDAGRTFKVVADEVKRLANASSSLSSQIRASVGACQVDLHAVHKTSTGLASHDMSRAIDSQRGLTAAVGKLDTVNKELDLMLASITQNVAEATRALQFEDMVTQILSATLQRVEGIGDLSVRALQVLERGQNGDRIAPLTEIVTSLRALGDRMAVQQQSMERGSVELF